MGQCYIGNVVKAESYPSAADASSWETTSPTSQNPERSMKGLDVHYLTLSLRNHCYRRRRLLLWNPFLTLDSRG